MRTLKITFPDDLYLIIRDRVDTEAYSSVSEYIRTLVREDRLRSTAALKRPRNSYPKPRRANDILLEAERRGD
jgi:Arc/MetJ-type ribon-helix-helix transcriptional regulator